MNKLIKLYSEKLVNPLDMKSEDINLMDIAQGLSNQCRFTGQCSQFYSVAQHSVGMVRYYLSQQPKEVQQYALLHDAAEAYLLDLPRPLKWSPEFKFYRDAIDKLDAQIFERFNLGLIKSIYPSLIHDIDRNHLIHAEGTRLFTSWWHQAPIPYIDKLPRVIPYWEPRKAKEKFLGMARELGLEVSESEKSNV